MNRKTIVFLCLGALAALLLHSCSCSEPPTDCPTADEIVALDIPDAAIIHWWDGSDFIYVPPASFSMGDASASNGDNTPAHPVELPGFWIQKTEVTNRMYALCAAAGVCAAPIEEAGTPSRFADPGYASHPVANVRWEDARNYCNWIGARLPTEAEWELSARGAEGRTYPWGEQSPSCLLANYGGCLDPAGTIQVDSYPGGLSPYGLADMSGNVFEWVNDWYGADYYAASPVQSPPGPASGVTRVTRGEGYLSAPESLPVFVRSSLDPEKSSLDLGFRCALAEAAFAGPTLPLCTAPPYIPIEMPAPGPAVNIQVPPWFTMELYCQTDNQNNQYGTAVITLGPGVDPNLVTIGSPNGAVTCTPDQNDPQKLNCAGSAFQPGGTATVDICHVLPPPPVLADPTCPLFYQLDETADICRYGAPSQAQCNPPNVDVPFYGCLPPPQNGDCPVGSYAGEYNGQPVCAPVGGLQCKCEGCPMTCPQGLVFTEGNACCSYPPDVPPACPTGFSYDANLNACTPDAPQGPACSSAIGLVPNCGLEACWITTTKQVFAGGPWATETTCVSPCPVGPPNGGPCNP